MYVNIGGVWKTVSKMWVRRSGVWKEIQRGSIYATHGDPSTTGWREFFKKGGSSPPPLPDPDPTPPPPSSTIKLNVTINPPAAYGTRNTPGLVLTSPASVASSSNGTPPFTYLWTLTSWDSPNVPQITNPTNASTTFSLSAPGLYDVEYTATFKCRVEDSLGNVGSKLVDATFIVTHPDGSPAP
jgi:hypothetical protein